jgi:hypothetical protein
MGRGAARTRGQSLLKVLALLRLRCLWNLFKLGSKKFHGRELLSAVGEAHEEDNTFRIR